MQTEPDWKEMYEWARRMAWNVVKREMQKSVNQPKEKGNQRIKSMEYWVDELRSAAVSHLCVVWQQYRHLPDTEFRKVISTILYYAMIADINEDKAKGTRAYEATEIHEDVTCAPKHIVSAEDELMQKYAHGGALEIEHKIDREIVMATIPKVCSPTENTIMQAMVADDDASAEEVAHYTGTTPGAVRLHKHNAVKKLKLFFNKDINENRPATL